MQQPNDQGEIQDLRFQIDSLIEMMEGLSDK